MTRLGYFRDALTGAHTVRVYHPDGWQGACAGGAHEAPTRLRARLWVLHRAWSVAGETRQLDRVLARLEVCAECGRSRGHDPDCSAVAELEREFVEVAGLRPRGGGLAEWLRRIREDRRGS